MNTHRRQFPFVALVASALVFIACATPAMALVETGSGRITFSTTASALYDSYMIGTLSHGGDYIYTVAPRLTYNHLIGPTGLQLYGGYSISRYQTNSRFNSNDFSGGISSSLPLSEGSRLNGRFGASYSESTQTDLLVNDRIPTKSYQFSFNGGYRTGLKTSISDSINYSRNLRDIYGNQTIWSNNLNFEYTDFLENTNLTVGHGYSRTQSTASNYSAWVIDPELLGEIPNSAIDQTSNTFNIGVTRPLYGRIIGQLTYGYLILQRSATETTQGTKSDKDHIISVNIIGPLLPPARFPKVESSANISYSQSRSLGINDTGSKTITGGLRLAWNARERTRLSFGASRAQSLGTNNFTVVSTSVNFGVVETIGSATTLAFDTSYTWSSVRGLDRQDELLGASVNLNHNLTEHWSLGGNFNYQNSQTNAAPSSFQATRYRLENYSRYTASAYVTFSY